MVEAPQGESVRHCWEGRSCSQDGIGVILTVRIFSRGTLIECWTKHPDAEQPLRLWFGMVSGASWQGPADLKKQFASASFLAGNRSVFNIAGSKYRLVAHVKYGPLHLLYIRFLGTHAEYDRIDATTI